MTGWQQLSHQTMTRNRTLHEIWLRYSYHPGWDKHTWQVQTSRNGDTKTQAFDDEAEARAYVDAYKQEWPGDWQPFTGQARVLFGPGQRPVYHPID